MIALEMYGGSGGSTIEIWKKQKEHKMKRGIEKYK
jgi:hypothetical protein